MRPEIDSCPCRGEALCEGPTTSAGCRHRTGKEYSGERIDGRKTLYARNALKCRLLRPNEDLGWRRRSFCGGYSYHGIAFKDERPELRDVSPDECVIRQEAALILESEASELSVWGPAEDHVAGVVGIFQKGRVGVFAAEAGCVFDLSVRCRGKDEEDCKTCNCRWLHSLPVVVCSTPILSCDVGFP